LAIPANRSLSSFSVAVVSTSITTDSFGRLAWETISFGLFYACEVPKKDATNAAATTRVALEAFEVSMLLS
jgi:hypothetical protein